MPQVLEAVTANAAPPAKPSAGVGKNEGFTQTLDQQKRQSQAADDRQQSAEDEAPEKPVSQATAEPKEVSTDIESPVAVQREALLIELELTDNTELVDTEAELLVPVLSEDKLSNVVSNHRPLVQASADATTTSSRVELGKQVAVSLEAIVSTVESEVDIDNQKAGANVTQLLSNDNKDPKIKNFNGLLEKQTGIPVPVGEQNWSKQFADRVLVLTQQGLSSAKLHLNPAELGPLEIRISVQQDQASLSISSSHALVRDSIEQSLPRLRELLEESGLTLVDVDVNAQSQQQDRGEPGQTDGEGESSVEDTEQSAAQNSPTTSSSRVDFYA